MCEPGYFTKVDAHGHTPVTIGGYEVDKDLCWC